MRELPEGYAFELPNESDVLLTASEFIINERLCCPFFDFTLEVEREGGPMWLSLKGRDGVKPFIMDAGSLTTLAQQDRFDVALRLC